MGELSDLLRAVAHAPEQAIAGHRVGRYVLIERIGRGGMGEVWRARDEQLERDVAVKLLAPEIADDPDRRRRFNREARAIAALSHPGLCAIHDVAEIDGVQFIAMELVPGMPLRELMTSRVSEARAREIALDVARALACVHDAGVVHRDLKPENVRVLPDGRAKLIDFGLARITHSPTPTTATEEGAVLGTPSYMSPEQAEGKTVDARSDVFSFGILLHELLNGKWPWPASSSSGRVAAILRDEPMPLGSNIDPALRRIVARCLAKEPERRYASAREIVAALEAAAPSSTRRAPLALAVSACVIFGAIAAGASVAYVRSTRHVQPHPRELRRLTDLPAREIQPALSPDGKHVVYCVERDGGMSLQLLRIGGDRPIPLTEERKGVFACEPAFSPDGASIAYIIGTLTGPPSLWVMGATGDSNRKILDTAYFPAWSPDSREIFYSTEDYNDAYGRGANSSIFAVEVATGKRRIIVDAKDMDAIEPSVSVTGAVAFWSKRAAPTSQRDLFWIPPGGGKPIALTDDAALDYSPEWSDDGNTLYFLSNRGGARNLWKLSIDDRAPTPVTFNTQLIADLDIAAKRAVFAVASTTATFTIYRIDERGRLSDKRVIHETTEEVYGGDIAPDGSIVVQTAGAQEDVLWISADGRERRYLTRDAELDRGPRFTANGNRVLFWSRRDGVWAMWTIAVDGSDRRRHADGLFGIPANDGRRAIIQPDTKKVQLLLDLETNALTKIEVSADDEVFSANKWAPDGDLVYGHLQHSGKPWEAAVLDVSTGHVERLGLPPHTWIHDVLDADTLIIARDERVYTRKLSSGQETLLLDEGLGLSLSSDRKRVVTVKVQNAADVWMLELGDES